MSYGITVNTGYPIHDRHPNRSGKYGLVYPAPGKSYTKREDAEAAFAEVVESQRKMRQEFVATLNEYTSHEEKTLKRESGERHPDAVPPEYLEAGT
jgi:hypothetical protein